MLSGNGLEERDVLHKYCRTVTVDALSHIWAFPICEIQCSLSSNAVFFLNELMMDSLGAQYLGMNHDKSPHWDFSCFPALHFPRMMSKLGFPKPFPCGFG